MPTAPARSTFPFCTTFPFCRQAWRRMTHAELRPKHPGWVIRAQSLRRSAGNFLAICRGWEGYFGSASCFTVVGDCWEEEGNGSLYHEQR